MNRVKTHLQFLGFSTDRGARPLDPWGRNMVGFPGETQGSPDLGLSRTWTAVVGRLGHEGLLSSPDPRGVHGDPGTRVDGGEVGGGTGPDGGLQG